MNKPTFVYVTYIRTTPEKLWKALTEPEFIRQYFMGAHQECAWKVGAPWKMVIPDGRVTDSGEVLEIDPPRRLVLAWSNQFRPELKADGVSKLTYMLEPEHHLVKLTVVHESDTPDSKLIKAVSGGWPLILSSLKCLLETGKSFELTKEWPKDDECIIVPK